MAGEKCDVCGNKSYAVLSSSLGAISFAYCRDCAESNAEPYGLLVSSVADFGSLDRLRENARDAYSDIITATLKVTGRTWEQFEIDVRLFKEKIEKVDLEQMFEHIENEDTCNGMAEFFDEEDSQPLWTHSPFAFDLTQEQADKVQKWDKCANIYHGCIGGHITYMLTPTSLGLIVNVKCEKCDEELDLTEWDNF